PGDGCVRGRRALSAGPSAGWTHPGVSSGRGSGQPGSDDANARARLRRTVATAGAACASRVARHAQLAQLDDVFWAEAGILASGTSLATPACSPTPGVPRHVPCRVVPFTCSAAAARHLRALDRLWRRRGLRPAVTTGGAQLASGDFRLARVAC